MALLGSCSILQQHVDRRQRQQKALRVLHRQAPGLLQLICGCWHCCAAALGPLRHLFLGWCRAGVCVPVAPAGPSGVVDP